jgi:hypothetical protein
LLGSSEHEPDADSAVAALATAAGARGRISATTTAAAAVSAIAAGIAGACRSHTIAARATSAETAGATLGRAVCTSTASTRPSG